MWNKNCRAREATDNKIIRLMHFACWVTEGIHTHTRKMLYLLMFLRQNLLRERGINVTFIRTVFVLLHRILSRV